MSKKKEQPRCKLCNRIKLDFDSQQGRNIHDKEILYFVGTHKGVTQEEIINHMHKWTYNHKEYCLMDEDSFECERPILPNRNPDTGLIEDCDPTLIDYHEMNKALLALEKDGIIKIDYEKEFFKVINREKLEQRSKELGLKI
jgi:hypothetical protein